MSKDRTLRALVSRRLAAAAEEIFGLFERTIAEYEAERRELLAGVYHRQLHAARADAQQLLVVEEAVPPEQQQEWISSLDREDPEPPHIKEEPVELWTIQEGEQLQGLEEAGFNFPMTSVTVKIEDGVEGKSQSSQFPERRTEENGEAEGLKPDAHEDFCCGSGSASQLDPDGPLQTATFGETSSSSSESETDGETSSSSGSDSETPSSECETDVSICDWNPTGQLQSGSNPLRNNDLPVGDTGCVGGARRLGGHGVRPKCVKEKPFSCSVCGRKFALAHHMTQHMAGHTGEKPYSCSFCSKGFLRLSNLKRHMAVHTGEKMFSCSFCGKEFPHPSNLKQHLTSHTGEKPFSCSVCGRRFTQHGSLTRHMTVHTGEKAFSCSVCGREFTQQSSLKRHLAAHREETM
ncbi:uncharacterized protein [Clinocottus analis]|uniref:uncharacterized protein n=1 Tax=Clinocottus analis TaxID=304258 RepID=UPI0035BF78F7